MRAALLSLWIATGGGLKVGVVGAHGGLGRELVQQCLERGWSPVAFVRRPYDPVLTPVRRGWLEEDPLAPRPAPLPHVPLLDAYTEACPDDLDALVFAMSGTPFASADASTAVVRRLCDTLPRSCARVCLVSAHGVGGGGNAGIRAMRDWYLRDTYAAKAQQETLVRAARPDALVLRPRVLSYGRIPLNPVATPRRELAREILDAFGKWTPSPTT